MMYFWSTILKYLCFWKPKTNVIPSHTRELPFPINKTAYIKGIMSPVGRGTIRAVHEGYAYRRSYKGKLEMWDHHYPNWQQEPVYTIEFDRPVFGFCVDKQLSAYARQELQQYKNTFFMFPAGEIEIDTGDADWIKLMEDAWND